MKFRATIKEFELEFEYIKEYGIRSMRSGGRSQTFEIRAAKFDLSRDCLYFHTSIHLHLHTYFIPVVFSFYWYIFQFSHFIFNWYNIQLVLLSVHLSTVSVRFLTDTNTTSASRSCCSYLIHLDRCFWQL